jgi:hypothetical protein
MTHSVLSYIYVDIFLFIYLSISLDGGSARRKAATYRQNDTNTE